MTVWRSLAVLSLLLAWPALGRAELRFAMPTVDLGELRGGPVYENRFDFTNNSADPIEIVNIHPGCGCLQPTIAKRVFQPGEKGTLVLHIRTLGQPEGPRTWQVRVQTRQVTKEDETVLTLAATIRNEITIEPSIIGMTVETTLQQEVAIKDHRPAPANITGVIASSPAIRVTTQAQGRGAAKIVLEVSGAALSANQQEATLDIYTDDPNYRQLQVPITLRKASRLAVSATPDKVEFRGAASDSRLVRLRAAGDQQVIVGRVEAENANVTCTWASGPGNDVTLKIRHDGSGVAAGAAKNVRVYLTAPSAMTLVIPVAIGKE